MGQKAKKVWGQSRPKRSKEEKILDNGKSGTFKKTKLTLIRNDHFWPQPSDLICHHEAENKKHKNSSGKSLF